MIETAIASRALSELEAVVDAGLRTFVAVGQALAEIRERKLYHEQHETFEAYCATRFGLKRQRAYELMTAARVVSQMSEISDILPERESHAAALADLHDPSTMVEAYTRAVEAADGNVTAAAVKQVAAEFRSPTRPRKTSKIEVPDRQQELPVDLSESGSSNAANLDLRDNLIADFAAHLRSEYLTKSVTVDGVESHHDRHCEYGRRPVCSRRCLDGQALLTRSELLG